MDKKAINLLLTQFEESSLRLLNERIEQIPMATGEGQVMTANTEQEFKRKLQYKNDIVREFSDFKSKLAPTSEEIGAFFTHCHDISVQAVIDLKTNSSWSTFVVDFMKDIANVCIQCLFALSKREPPQFFTTTNVVENTQADINTIEKTMESFDENVKKGLLYQSIEGDEP